MHRMHHYLHGGRRRDKTGSDCIPDILAAGKINGTLVPSPKIKALLCVVILERIRRNQL